MSAFRKKPVVIDAVQVTDEWFTVDHPSDLHPVGVLVDPVQRCVFIDTLEGQMRGDVGNWIITGVKGEKYPCKPDVFAATYEPAATPTSLPPSERAEGERIGALLRLVQEAMELIDTYPGCGGCANKECTFCGYRRIGEKWRSLGGVWQDHLPASPLEQVAGPTKEGP